MQQKAFVLMKYRKKAFFEVENYKLRMRISRSVKTC